MVDQESEKQPVQVASGLNDRLGAVCEHGSLKRKCLVCEYRDKAWNYRKVLNQIRDNPNTRHEVEAQLGGILDVLDA